MQSDTLLPHDRPYDASRCTYCGRAGGRNARLYFNWFDTLPAESHRLCDRCVRVHRICTIIAAVIAATAVVSIVGFAMWLTFKP